MTQKKLLKRRFFHSLKRGTGEAYLIARDNPTVDFSEYIIKGALENFAYDGQCESSRAQYIFDINSLSNQQEKIRSAVLLGIRTHQTDTWSLTQLFDLVKIYALRGDLEAKQAILDRFLNETIEGSDWVGRHEILELDGMEGLKFIAEKTGKRLEKDPDDWQNDSIIRYFQRDNPLLKVMDELEKASQKNRFIQLYLENVRRMEENQKNHKQEMVIYKDVIEEVILSKPYIWLVRRKLSDEEVNSVAKQLLIEKNKHRQEKLLYVFTHYKFPFDSKFILSLAKEKPIYRNRVTEFAIDALQFFQSEEIRDFALEKLKTTSKPEAFVNILVSNYKTGDHQLLTAIAEKFNSENTVENLACSYIDIYKSNKTKDCKQPLEIIYGKMNCGIHRNDIVSILVENSVLSDQIRQEIRYDSHLETRGLFCKM